MKNESQSNWKGRQGFWAQPKVGELFLQRCSVIASLNGGIAVCHLWHKQYKRLALGAFFQVVGQKQLGLWIHKHCETEWCNVCQLAILAMTGVLWPSVIAYRWCIIGKFELHCVFQPACILATLKYSGTATWCLLIHYRDRNVWGRTSLAEPRSSFCIS